MMTTNTSKRVAPSDCRLAALPLIVVLLAFGVVGGCTPQRASAPQLAGGIDIVHEHMPALHARMVGAITSAPPSPDWKGGLVGAVGGARVKLLKTGKHELLNVLPQLTETQIPVSYAITFTPPGAALGFQLRTREGTDTNVVISVSLGGDRGQEVQVDWSAVLLLVPPPANPTVGAVEPYRRETACAQSSAEAVRALADQLWPEDGAARMFAVNIQEYIRTMQQRNPPRSMDAMGILESGGNWICTANANLATALLRAKGLPARSLAVIPTTGQRLEMHRIVEYHDVDHWVRFDPSSIHRDVPMQPWQSVVMATTTPGDEDLAMEPRMGTSLGAPYGQELEFVSGRMTFSGPQFFWTVARPLAGFDVDAETATLARQAWERFLETGQLSAGQLSAATATNAAGLLEALRTPR